MMEVERLDKAELLRLTQTPELADAAWPDSFAAIGNRQLLATTKTAVLCSRQCPGEVILRVYDLAKRLRDRELTFIGGFHTPAERDFLQYLLAGSCRLIVCSARSLDGMRLPAAWQTAVEAERMLLLSPFTAAAQRRQTARLAERRNELVVTLADQILLLHASPNSHTAQLLSATTEKPLTTLALDDEMLCRQLTSQ